MFYFCFLNGTFIFEILLNQLLTSIFVSNIPFLVQWGILTSIEQSMALKAAYSVMKANLLNYKPQIKRKPIFHITKMFYLSLKLDYI